jgi:hypothetical protein
MSRCQSIRAEKGEGRMPVIDVEFARTRGQSEREGFLYVDMHPMLAQRVLKWQHALMSADQQVPEWTSIARWQVVRALIALGYQLPEQPVRYTTRCRDIDASGAFRTRLALVPSVAAACLEEARYRECDLREVVNACLASLPDEPPTLPPRMERAELQRLYLEQRNARAREVRRARANGEEPAMKKAGRLSQLERDAAAVGSMLQAVVPIRPDVYVERFLLLCKEREARDRWLLKGGKGKPPASTVDDHLGRKRGTFNADKIAASKNYQEWRAGEGTSKGGKKGGKASAAQMRQRERLGNTWVL